MIVVRPLIQNWRGNWFNGLLCFYISIVSRYKAEVDFDGRELARSYLQQRNLQLILKTMNEAKSEADAQVFYQGPLFLEFDSEMKLGDQLI